MKEQFNDKATLMNWIDGILQYNPVIKGYSSIERIVDQIETENSASVKGTLTIDKNTYAFEIKLTK